MAAAWHGLASRDAGERLKRFGHNRLPEPPRQSALHRLLAQFKNLMIVVLLCAAAVTALLGHWIDSGVILVVVLVNAVIGFVQEGKAERALEAIRHLLAPRAVVLRDGNQIELDAADLVPGDIVLLAPGDRLPADVRVLQARNLHIDEAALTGESVPVNKDTSPVAANTAIGDRLCMAYAGTLVTQGQARALVVATGSATEIGRIGRMLEAVAASDTPLLRKMSDFGKTLTSIILVAAGMLFGFGLLVRDMPLGEVFLAAVGLAVAAIPEGLPIIMTVGLAIGVQRMAARNAVIRRLPAVETLGSVTVICSDKTGTLTRNEMTVQQLVCAGATIDVEGAGYEPEGELSLNGVSLDVGNSSGEQPALAALLDVAALCNDAVLHQQAGLWQLTGDPTEGALLTLAMKAGINVAERTVERPRLDVIPFASEYRFMATLHPAGEPRSHTIALVKGAPEQVLAMCQDQIGADGRLHPLDLAWWTAAVDQQARAGRRVLALAQRRLAGSHLELRHADVEHGLTMLGVVGIIDPPRNEAIEAVARCHAAGIRVVMITGDHAVTASAIATQLGLGTQLEAIDGPAIETMDDEHLRDAVRSVQVFARASPEHKLRLVRALQSNGEVVAMTGDGVNDAPALKQADVGIAMGMKGTDAARQASAIVLADDNFASIAHAVEQGRAVYDNLKKTVSYMLPINGGESLSLLLAVLLGLTLPIAPVQILWVNMVSSVALAMVLAFEPTEPDVMRRPPRPPSEPILSGFVLWRIGFVSTLFLAGIFGMYSWSLATGSSEETARTVAVNALVCMEVFYLFSVRYLKSPSFTSQGVRGTPRVLLAVAGVVVLQLAFTFLPLMQVLFDTTALPLSTGLVILGVGIAVFLVMELEKALLRGLGWTPR